MKFSTDGLVIREQRIKEGDKVITLLTRDKGVIRAFVNGANNIKSPKTTATGLITYSQFDIYLSSKGTYTIDDAHAKEVFMPLRQSIDKMALTQYFCELAEQLAPRDANAEDVLRLTLNSIYMLANDKRPPDLIKSVFELRIMSVSGYMPDLVSCCRCHCYESDKMYFLPESGLLICGNCANDSSEKKVFTGKSLTNAMRHCVYSEFNKLFSFTMSDKAASALGNITENYCTAHIEKKLNTLDFYKQVRNLGE